MAKGSKTAIAHSCPFCGGPVELDDDRIISSCGNCGSLLRLLPGDGLDSYLLEGELAKREALFFLDRDLKKQGSGLIKDYGEVFQVLAPFYRAVGKVYSFSRRVVEYKKYTEEGQEVSFQGEQPESQLKRRELNFAAFNLSGIGLESMGVRSAVRRLAPLTPARCQDRLFLRIDYDVNYALERYQKTCDSISALAATGSADRFSKALPPDISIVYISLWIINYRGVEGNYYAVIDCPAKRAAGIYKGRLTRDSLSLAESVTGRTFQFAAHRCPHCACDLPPQKGGEVFVCGNCGRIYSAWQENYYAERLLLPAGSYRNVTLFPFWMFRMADSSEARALKRCLRLDSELVFIPAFDVSNFKRMAGLALALSRTIKEINLDKIEKSEYNLKAACVTSAEARRMMLPMLVAGLDNPELSDLEAIWRLNPELSETSLVWLQFAEEGNFYRGLLAGQGFEKAILKS